MFKWASSCKKYLTHFTEIHFEIILHNFCNTQRKKGYIICLYGNVAWSMYVLKAYLYKINLQSVSNILIST